MKKFLPLIAAAIMGCLFLAPNQAKAWEDWAPNGCVRKHVAAPRCDCCRPRHRHVARRPAPPAPPPPAKVVEEKPAQHVTHIEEVVVVHHKVIEEPTVVVAPRPACSPCAALPPRPICSPCGQVGGPVQPGAFREQQVVANASPVGQLIHKGCPAGVKIGDVFECEGPTGRCICK